MSDLKVSCPSCGQHIAYDANWAGRQINCPTCQTAMTIPGASAAPPPPPPPSAPPPPQRPAGPSLSRPAGPMQMAQTPRPMPVPGPSRPPEPMAGSGKTSGLAITSLVCGLVFCLAPFTSIAAVICGHLARGGIRRDPSLKGAGLALAGLIMGYVFSGLAVLWLIMLLVIPGGLAAYMNKRVQQFPPPSTQPGQPAPTKPDGNPTVRTGPRLTTPRRVGGMAYQESKLEMPDKPVTGKFGASDFTYEHAILENGWLTLRQGADFMADAEVKVVLFGSNAQAEGKTYAVPPANRSGTTPHLHMSWQENGGRRSTSMTGGYTMTLKFEKFENDQVRGSIELETQKAPVVKLKGDFIAKVK